MSDRCMWLELPGGWIPGARPSEKMEADAIKVMLNSDGDLFAGTYARRVLELLLEVWDLRDRVKREADRANYLQTCFVMGIKPKLVATEAPR